MVPGTRINLHLKMSSVYVSVEYSCKLFKPIFAYRQTVWTLIRLLLEQKWLLKSQAGNKADYNCSDWQFKG